jgi:hypothetical protein
MLVHFLCALFSFDFNTTFSVSKFQIVAESVFEAKGTCQMTRMDFGEAEFFSFCCE